MSNTLKKSHLAQWNVSGITDLYSNNAVNIE